MTEPFLYQDFVRVHEIVRAALLEGSDPYVLVTGETGTGKTALLKKLKAELDRTRVKVCYFSQAARLGATGLIRVVSETLRVHGSPCYALTFERLQRALAEESQRLLLWFDEAHELPQETLGEARALVESDLDQAPRVQVLLAGMSRLRVDLKAKPHLWRRVGVREELLGLKRDEISPFVAHHFGPPAAKRFCEKGFDAIFEHGKGAPGLLLPIVRRVLLTASGKNGIEVEHVADALSRFDLD